MSQGIHVIQNGPTWFVGRMNGVIEHNDSNRTFLKGSLILPKTARFMSRGTEAFAWSSGITRSVMGTIVSSFQ